MENDACGLRCGPIRGLTRRKLIGGCLTMLSAIPFLQTASLVGWMVEADEEERVTDLIGESDDGFWYKVTWKDGKRPKVDEVFAGIAASPQHFNKDTIHILSTRGVRTFRLHDSFLNGLST